MLIKEESFRNLYRSLVVIKNEKFAKQMNRSIQEIDIMADDLSPDEKDEKIKAIEVPGDINAIFAGPYVDHDRGLSFVLLSTGTLDGDSVSIMKRKDLSNLHIFTKANVSDSKFEYIENLKVNDGFDINHYRDFTDAFIQNTTSEAMEALRSMDILDSSREPDYPDDIIVQFIREGFKIESMWVRYENIDDEGLIEGHLLNTPHQDLGIESGDIVKIFPYKLDDEWIIVCDLNKD